ncbi:MAG: rdd family protein [Deltaproteobacteria bacterium]|nr:rdd family protein [Deltaproteobacteria bacterium]
MDGNNDLFAGKMKCKRCRAYVPDDSNVCPMCGEDLTFLRELLKSVYEEDPKPGEPQISPASLKEPVKEVLEEPLGKPGEPRVILNSDPIDLGADYRVTFSMTDGLGPEEPASDSSQPPAWDHALRGGFWRRLLAFEVDLLLLAVLLAIFIVAGFIAAEWGAGEGGMSLVKKAQAIVILILPLAMVLTIVYFSFFHAAWGQTIGKMIFRVRVVQTSGEPLTFPLALLRTFAYLISAIPAFLGFIWMGFTSGKRAWHDLISGTIVVREQ